MQTTTHSDNETKELGKKIATQLKGGDIVCLYGELGSGKTTLVKGLAEGLGIKEDITSPTFTLMNIYKISNIKYLRDPARDGAISTLVHIDTYRLKNEQELIQIGVEDYLGQPDTITIIEWPEKVEGLLKDKKIIKITLEHGTNSERTITKLS
ncbi:MAG: tRNA (adenosine(37)-N6)-threonylcarbamoyltransferase complex ATPase subunit type 1 TsaE [Candidatus Magasanikbacteria bacterium RIFCSPHIGHO2_01_FULL_47_8]|uniref:tRNA threonylcarbamoyladenosine biosynthesis protein TsaE n=1 Tax=Candidatus Magasanikbacteria bacterium RIFCSPHIGHO2_01_FULL_47_8 TaxID=1798673 RepID=A0A1F6MFH0_9BACT|nr:MAG: tRNA (adenosine(37)-N6)-threonylcarbamoyltransferase complex ATPase subunit type 1 TsaE [Candidatus Magasanikbacteria bacterium RIFCSPHIGHO2_01_FULL_47_8]